MGITGGCHCGAIRYEAEGTPIHAALCHCVDCRKSSGAHSVGWMLFPAEQVRITGAPVTYASSEHGRRQFCATCGTGLFYLSDTIFKGQIDIQLATLDDPDAVPPGACIQMADAPAWLTGVPNLPSFERFPG